VKLPEGERLFPPRCDGGDDGVILGVQASEDEGCNLLVFKPLAL